MTVERADGGGVLLGGNPAERLRYLVELARGAVSDSRVVSPWMPQSPLATAVRISLLTVQGLPYVPDPPGARDLVRDPWETSEIGGDCEDLAVLLGVYLTRLRVRWDLLWMHQGESGAPLDHVTVQLRLDSQWFWADPTVRGARLGEHPYDAVERLGVDGHRLTGRALGRGLRPVR